MSKPANEAENDQRRGIAIDCMAAAGVAVSDFAEFGRHIASPAAVRVGRAGDLYRARFKDMTLPEAIGDLRNFATKPSAVADVTAADFAEVSMNAAAGKKVHAAVQALIAQKPWLDQEEAFEELRRAAR